MEMVHSPLLGKLLVLFYWYVTKDRFSVDYCYNLCILKI